MKKMQIKRTLIHCIVFFTFGPTLILAEDFGQSLGGDAALKKFESDLSIKAKEEREYPSSKKEKTGHLENSVELSDYEKELDRQVKNIDEEDNELDVKGSHLPGSPSDSSFSSKTKNDVFGESLPGHFEKNENYNEYRNKDLVASKFNKSDHSYSFIFIKDTYDYSDENNVYKKTFEDSEKGHKIGGVHVDYRSYISKGLINTHWGFSLGIGHSRAKGLFIDDSSISRTTFQIWTFPIDLWLGLEMRLSQLFKVSMAAGPSVLPILQSRNDREHEDEDKEYHQLGTGYSGLLKTQLNISAFSADTGFNMLSNYGISNLYFDLALRYQNYNNFKDNIVISGMSFGAGFTFEYL